MDILKQGQIFVLYQVKPQITSPVVKLAKSRLPLSANENERGGINSFIGKDNNLQSKGTSERHQD